MSCPICGSEIPFHRHGNSPYCSDECSREARRRTSAEYYEQSKRLRALFWRQARLLEKYYDIQQLGHPLHYEHLKEDGFNFGYSLSETFIPTGEIASVVGSYAYYLNPKTKTVQIWKLKSN